jgi:hypothetical protein
VLTLPLSSRRRWFCIRHCAAAGSAFVIAPPAVYVYYHTRRRHWFITEPEKVGI